MGQRSPYVNPASATVKALKVVMFMVGHFSDLIGPFKKYDCFGLRFFSPHGSHECYIGSSLPTAPNQT